MIEYPILIILALGLVCLLMPSGQKLILKALSFAGALYCLGYGIYNFVKPFQDSYTGLFLYMNFSGFIGLACAFFGFITATYSLRYADSVEKPNKYYGYIFICVSFALFAVYSSNLITLTVFWGLSGLMLYLLATLSPGASNAAKKTFIFAGGSDSLMVLGVCIFGILSGSFEIYEGSNRIMLSGSSPAATVSFLCLIIAALTKAGAMPFHTWVPDFAQEVPMSLTAFLPAALDKLMGIFLLTIICHQLFILNTAMMLLLLLTGAVTVIAAVYMAMIQHDMKKLLAYHAVSQVGYMIIGIVSGTVVGIAGGLFHMINHTLYKSGLFLSGGAVEKRAGTTNLDKLGGLSRYMPLTFVVCLVASLSISGIPPLNGFVSKWMIYQGIVEQMTNSWLSPAVRICFTLVLAVLMFGSALTLASFVKLLHSVFLGQPSETDEALKSRIKEVSPLMLVPMGIIAVLCIVFGLFAFSVPLRQFILPGLADFGIYTDRPFFDLWQNAAAAVLILVSLLFGLLIYLFGNIKSRKDKPFAGCEDLPLEAKAEGTGFYRSIADMAFFKTVYSLVEKKYFDMYNIGTKIVLGFGSVLSAAHTGNLRSYILWFLVGMVFIFAILLREF
ncbi:MAG: proton-conducting transporter membrane subunit [Elusimicrobiota bacterium]